MDNPPALSLPVELWIKIVAILRDDVPHGSRPACFDSDIKAVRPLTESCRWLYAVLQPLLYENIMVDFTETETHKIGSLASTLSTRPDLRSSVRNLELEGTYPGDDWDPLLAVLPLLVEIRCLVLDTVVIEEEMVKLLHNAVGLRTLHITYSEWGTDVPENWSEGGSFGENLTELCVHQNADLPDQIQRDLQLFVPTVTKLSMEAKLIAELAKLPAFLCFGPSLLQLVSYANKPIYHLPLHQFLSRSPNIEDLDADRLRLVSPIDEEYLPNLQSIKAHNSLVTALLPGRPIRSITTTAVPMIFINPLPWLEILRLSGLSERRGGLEVIDGLWVACPGLIRLELGSINTDDFSVLTKRIETRLTLDAAALPRLQVLHLKHHLDEHYWGRSIQAPFLEEMLSEGGMIAQVKRQHCPDLCDVWIRPQHAWTYAREDHAWTPQARSYNNFIIS